MYTGPDIDDGKKEAADFKTASHVASDFAATSTLQSNETKGFVTFQHHCSLASGFWNIMMLFMVLDYSEISQLLSVFMASFGSSYQLALANS